MAGIPPAVRIQAYLSGLNYPQLLFFILNKKLDPKHRIKESSDEPQIIWDAYYAAVTDAFFMESAFKKAAKGINNLDIVANVIDDNDLFENDYKAALRKRAEKIIRAEIEYRFEEIVKMRKLDRSQLKNGAQDPYYIEAADDIWKKYYDNVKDHPEDIYNNPELKVAKFLADRMRSPEDYFEVPDFMIGAETWTSAFVKINAILLSPVIGSILAEGFFASALVSCLTSATSSALEEAAAYQYGDKKVRDETELSDVLYKVGIDAVIGFATGLFSGLSSQFLIKEPLKKSIPPEIFKAKLIEVASQAFDVIARKAYLKYKTGQDILSTDIEEIVTTALSLLLSLLSVEAADIKNLEI